MRSLEVTFFAAAPLPAFPTAGDHLCYSIKFIFFIRDRIVTIIRLKRAKKGLFFSRLYGGKDKRARSTAFLDIAEGLGLGVAAKDKIKIADVKLG